MISAIPVQCSTIVIFTSSSVVHMYVLHMLTFKKASLPKGDQGPLARRKNCSNGSHGLVRMEKDYFLPWVVWGQCRWLSNFLSEQRVYLLDIPDALSRLSRRFRFRRFLPESQENNCYFKRFLISYHQARCLDHSRVSAD